MTDHPARTFVSIAEAVAYGHTRGLRSITCQYAQAGRGESEPHVMTAIVQVGDSLYQMHGTGATLEAAENKALARTLSIALGITIGANGNGTQPTSDDAPARASVRTGATPA